MKLQDLTFNDCIVSSTPEEWATVQNIFLLAGYELALEGNNENFENYPFTCFSAQEGKMYLNTPEMDVSRFHKPLPAADFIAANTEETNCVPWTPNKPLRQPSTKYVIRGSTNATDLEQLQDEIEMAVRKDVFENSHLFDMPFQVSDAMVRIDFIHLRELLAQRFPLMNSTPADSTDNKNEPSSRSSNVL